METKYYVRTILGNMICVRSYDFDSFYRTLKIIYPNLDMHEFDYTFEGKEYHKKVFSVPCEGIYAEIITNLNYLPFEG